MFHTNLMQEECAQWKEVFYGVSQYSISRKSMHECIEKTCATGSLMECSFVPGDIILCGCVVLICRNISLGRRQ